MSEEYVTKSQHEADIAILSEKIENAKERLSDYKEHSARQINLWGISIAAMAVLFAGMQIGITIALWWFSK